eukprot:2837991-Amphidinium_carterae.1
MRQRDAMPLPVVGCRSASLPHRMPRCCADYIELCFEVSFFVKPFAPAAVTEPATAVSFPEQLPKVVALFPASHKQEVTKHGLVPQRSQRLLLG